MEFRVTARRAQPDTADAPLLVLALSSGATLTPALTAVDTALGGSLKRSLDRKDFRGARDETLLLAGGAKGPQRVKRCQTNRRVAERHREGPRVHGADR